MSPACRSINVSEVRTRAERTAARRVVSGQKIPDHQCAAFALHDRACAA
jgi:hypothetical protein